MWKRFIPRCGKISTRFSAICRTAFCFSLKTGARFWFQRRRAAFCNVDHDGILGRHAREIFDQLDRAGPDAARGRRSRQPTMVKEEIRTENGRRIQASVDFIYDDETHRGWARW